MPTRLVAPHTNHLNASAAWRGLEISSGSESQSEVLQKLGERVNRLHEDAGALAALKQPKESSRLVWEREQRSRLKTGEALLVVDSEGQLVQMFGQLKGRSGSHYDTVGNYDPELSHQLKKMRYLAAQCEARHLDELPQIVRLPEQGILLEIGAGSYYERLKALSALALKQRGEFIAHDPAPAAARAAQAEAPQIPYWALPPVADFLGAALREAGRPIVITGKNVLSVMSAERGQDLLGVCAAATPERLVLSLSLQFLSNNSSIPENLRLGPTPPYPEGFLNLLHADSQLASVFPREISQLVFPFAATQGYVTFKHALLDAVSRDLLARGRELGIFQNGYALSSHKNSLIPAEDTGTFFASHPLGHTEAGFRLGYFNTIQIGAFGYNIAIRPNVPQGALLIEQNQIHFIYEREALHDTKKLKIAENSTLVDLSRDIAVVPRCNRTLNPLLIMFGLARDPKFSADVASMLGQQAIKAQNIGAKAAVDLLFQMQQYEVPWFSGNFVGPLRTALKTQYGA